MPSATITYVETYNIQYCSACDIGFAIEADFEKRRRQDKKTFYCPHGHPQYFPGKTEADKLRERLEQRDRELNQEMQRVVDERKAHAVTKGKLTKVQNRAAKAMCPVDGCHRHFVNMARHVASQHPEFVAS